MTKLKDIKLVDVMPDSIARDSEVQNTAESIDPQLKIISECTDIPALYTHINSLSTEVLDHLAYQYDLAVWRDTWNIVVKRNVLLSSIIDKRKKGTVSAVKNALESLGSAAQIVEWWERNPKGTPHTFTVYIQQREVEGIVPAETQNDLFALIDDSKPVRSHYDFILSENIEGTLGIAGCIRCLTVAMVRLIGIEMIEAKGTIGTKAVSRPIVSRYLVARA